MNRAHANAREDKTELERVVDELYEFDFYTDGGNIGGNEVEPWLRRSLKSYAQTVAEEAVRGAYKNAIALSDKIELSEDLPDEGVGQWKAFKRFRNTLRDTYLTPLPDKE